MSKTREKAPVMQVKTIEQAEAAFAEYAIADARIAKINAQMDEQFTAIRKKYADELQDCADVKERKFAELQFFAEGNEEHFIKRKSLEMAHGIIGFRTGTPKLKTLKKFTWGAVTELLKIKLPNYVRTVEEPMKDKLLADRDLADVNKHFEKCGFEVVQDESFFVEPKKEGV